jgi:hypothetical protein
LNDDRRRQRRETRILQDESVWLQKALFALRKAADARERLSDLRDEEAEPYALVVDDRGVAMEAIEDALEERIERLIRNVRERRRNAR